MRAVEFHRPVGSSGESLNPARERRVGREKEGEKGREKEDIGERWRERGGRKKERKEKREIIREDELER